MTQAQISSPEVLADTDLDARTHLIRVSGDASLARYGLRSMAAAAVAGGRTATIVDLTAAIGVTGPLAWELSRAHERLLWRGGQLVVVSDPAAIQPMFDAFGLHRAPDVVETLDEALAAVHVGEPGAAVAHAFELDGAMPPSPPAGGAAVEDPGSEASDGHATGDSGAVEVPRNGTSTALPIITGNARGGLPASWSFRLRGGTKAPRVARAAIGRVLSGRLDHNAHEAAVLLVSEAVSNSVKHGGAGESGTVDLSVVVTGGAVRVAVADPTGGFDPPPLPEDPLAPAGRGLPIIHRLATTWGVESPPGGHLWFELARPAA